MPNPPWNDVARQLLRALRGPRSQVAFSRRLGYTTNVAADWEVARRFPTGGRTLEVAARCGVDVDAVIEQFSPRTADAWRADGLPGWLRALAGRTSQLDLAQRSGATRFQIGRWLRGDAEPRLPQLLALVDACTGRVGDWAGALARGWPIPALDQLTATRREVLRLAYDEPWSAALLVGAAIAPPVDPEGWLAERLGLPRARVVQLLEVMVRGGVVERTAAGLKVVGQLTVDVPPDGDVARIRRHWAQVATERLAAPHPADRFSFNVCALSRADLERVQALQAAYFRELRSIVAASEPLEVVAVVTMHTACLADRT